MLNGLNCTILFVGETAPENRSRLEAQALRLCEAEFTVTSILERGEPDDVIASQVESSAVGFLVMGAYGHSHIRRLVIGSTTTEFVRCCRIPVLVFR